MRIIIERFCEEGDIQYIARSVESKDKKEYIRLLRSPEEYESFHLHGVEYYHKEKCSEVVYQAVSWTKKREEITNECYFYQYKK